jgi:hypothetical protein
MKGGKEKMENKDFMTLYIKDRLENTLGNNPLWIPKRARLNLKAIRCEKILLFSRKNL